LEHYYQAIYEQNIVALIIPSLSYRMIRIMRCLFAGDAERILAFRWLVLGLVVYRGGDKTARMCVLSDFKAILSSIEPFVVGLFT
jgi:hypothetical protein